MPSVFVNNHLFDLPEGATLLLALEQNGIVSQKGIAVAINNAVIPKAEWSTLKLADSDKITIIKATQGG